MMTQAIKPIIEPTIAQYGSTMPVIRLPPGEPVIMKPRGDSMKLGVIEESMRLPGSMRFALAPIRP